MQNRTFLIFFVCLATSLWISGCASTKITESPKTAYVSDVEPEKEPQIIWTSRTLTKGFDYLGKIQVRSWSYDGALARLIAGAKTLKADAVIDVHYERIGFLNAMSAFAVKYKN